MKTIRIMPGQCRGMFAVALSVGAVYCAVCTVLPTLSGRLIDTVLSASPAQGLPALAAFACVSLAQAVLAIADQAAGCRLLTLLKQQMRREAAAALLSGGPVPPQKRDGFVSFVNNDIPTVAQQYFSAGIDLVKCSVLILLSAGTLFSLHWSLAVLSLGFSGLLMLAPAMLRRCGSAARSGYSQALGGCNTVLHSMLEGLGVIQALGCRPYAIHTVEAQNDRTARAERRLFRWQLTTQSATVLLQTGKTAGILLAGVGLIAAGVIPVGGLVAAIQLDQLMSAPLEVLAVSLHRRNEARPLAEKYRQLTQKAAPAVSPLPPFQRLELFRVGCRAGKEQLLQDISLTLGAGEKLLVTGGSGSGKSTLLNLIARAGAEPCGGAMRYNGMPARACSAEGWRRSLCLVPQQPFLFYATLEENICLGRDIAPELYRRVVQALRLDELLTRYHGQTMTPERVQNLSGGERQRVALARALVGQPDVLLLDEPTSAQDPDTARAIETLLLDCPAAVIHVSHRPSPELAGRYDGHCRMEGGRLTRLR